mgnify:FL=1|jgi:hypothetical protein
MEQILLNIYKNNFIIKSDISKYLKMITTEIDTTFTKKQIDFFIKCNKEKLDLIALEYNMRKRQKNNIFSFVFLRLSSLAESTVENQNKYVNKSKANIFKIFVVLSMAVINTIILELKGFYLKNKVKEYLDV